MATRKTKTQEVSNIDNTPEDIEGTSEKAVEVIPKTAKRTHEKDELIMCKSITPGELGMVGKKTGILYKWSNIGDEIEVEYQDLMAARLTHSQILFSPNIIIENDSLINEWKDIKQLYDTMYAQSDLEEILKLSPSQIKSVVKQLPEGAKSALKVLAATNIQNGKLDSIKKVIALDEIFETNLLAEIELFR